MLTIVSWDDPTQISKQKVDSSLVEINPFRKGLKLRREDTWRK